MFFNIIYIIYLLFLVIILIIFEENFEIRTLLLTKQQNVYNTEDKPIKIGQKLSLA